MDWLAVAERFIDREFPRATIAVLAGSTAREARTATSDIDLVLIGPAEMFDDGRTALASTFEFEHEVVEVFAYTEEGFEQWAQRGVTEFRPVVLDMLLEGRPVRHPPQLDGLRARWGPVVEAGPQPAAHRLDLLRYAVTGLLDDLCDATDPLERQVSASAVFIRTAELMLLTNGRWIGSGKYLPRLLREFDTERADRLAGPILRNDYLGLAESVQRELDAAGGRLQAGFTR